MGHLLDLGTCVATPEALARHSGAGQAASEFPERDRRLDPGDLDGGDEAADRRALCDDSRIFPAFTTKDGERLWVITEAIGVDDRRASTCVMDPASY